MAKKSSVPQARDALDKFKMEAAREVGASTHLEAIPLRITKFKASPTEEKEGGLL